MLLAALARPERIAALIGIAAAPDFTENLIWEVLSAEDKQKMEKDGVYYAPSCYDDESPYPITYHLIEEARQHLLLNRPEIAIDCPVRLIQGMQDIDVPWKTSLVIQEKMRSNDVQVTLVKDGDHRMSAPYHLSIIQKQLITMVS